VAAVLLGWFTGNRLLELRHDFHEEGVFVLEERNAGGVAWHRRQMSVIFFVNL